MKKSKHSRLEAYELLRYNWRYSYMMADPEDEGNVSPTFSHIQNVNARNFRQNSL